MKRAFFAFASIALVGLLSIGCSGYSADQATERCDVERTAKGSMFTDKSYADCIDCFESCGDSCKPLSTSPETYACE